MQKQFVINLKAETNHDITALRTELAELLKDYPSATLEEKEKVRYTRAEEMDVTLNMELKLSEDASERYRGGFTAMFAYPTAGLSDYGHPGIYVMKHKYLACIMGEMGRVSGFVSRMSQEQGKVFAKLSFSSNATCELIPKHVPFFEDFTEVTPYSF